MGRSTFSLFEQAEVLLAWPGSSPDDAQFATDIRLFSQGGLSDRLNPIMRLKAANGDRLRGEISAWWFDPPDPPQMVRRIERPAGRRCIKPTQSRGICVAAPVAIDDAVLEDILVRLGRAATCGRQGNLLSGVINHSEDLMVRVNVSTDLQSYRCNAPFLRGDPGSHEATIILTAMRKLATQAFE